MSRKIWIESRELPYHICARANRRAPFPGDLRFSWKTLAGELYLQNKLHGLRVHAFVMMPNHFHLLATSPNTDVPSVIRDYLSSVTRLMNTRNQQWGRIFGGRYHWSLISNPLHFAHALKYVYRNPVKAGICAETETYEFSTLAGLVGKIPLPVPIAGPLQNMDSFVPERGAICSQLLAWLNQPHRTEENAAIQKALKKKKFEMPVDRKTRKRIILDPLE